MSVVSAALEFESVTKDYRSVFSNRSRRALDGFSLSVQPGEILGFLGPNGAGKTTAIHIALGFLRPSSGSGHLLGVPFGVASIRKRIGFLPENVAFYHRPARKLIRFYGALNGVGDLELKRRTEDLLNHMDLSLEANRSIAKLSRGMLQRIGIAQALINNPDLVILDEPTSALDPASRVKVRELLLSLKNQGKTVFLSSHLLSEIELVCDRVAILKQGQLVRVAKTGELLESRNLFSVEFRNVLPEILRSEGFSTEPKANGLLQARVSSAEQRRIIEAIWNAGGEIVSVMPARQTLEDVFLELTGGEAKK